MHSTTEAGKKRLAYFGLVFVIILWGIHPLVTLFFYRHYSPTVRITFSSLICAIALLILSWKKRALLSKAYFKVAIPTGFFMSLANILQKIGLQYTTPAHYAFLENLSVLVVPVLMFFFLQRRPSFLTVFAALLCLLSSFILAGMSGNTGSSSLAGDLLCALAGLLYGFNIAGTGAFAGKLYAPLYLMIQMFTEVAVSFAGTLLFHVTGIEQIRFSLDWRLILANIVIVFISSTLCWLIRTNAMKHVDATVVAVMMPFSSVVTTVVSVLAGNDKLTANLVIGIVLGLAAIILSGFADQKNTSAKVRSPAGQPKKHTR